MASPRLRRLRNYLTALAFFGLGLWLTGSALWQLGATAIYVYKSVVVTGTVMDMRRKPFESWSETIGKGNWSFPGDASYQPTVRFTLPGGIDAIRIDMDIDNVDYLKGQQVRIICPPGQPGKAHLYRGKFLWGASCLRLGTGALLTLIGYALLRRLRGRKAATAQPKRNKASAPPPEETAESKPARRRKTASTSGSKSTSSSPRRRKKADTPEADATPKKPRRSRKKKADAQQAELPF